MKQIYNSSGKCQCGNSFFAVQENPFHRTLLFSVWSVVQLLFEKEEFSREQSRRSSFYLVDPQTLYPQTRSHVWTKKGWVRGGQNNFTASEHDSLKLKVMTRAPEALWDQPSTGRP